MFFYRACDEIHKPLLAIPTGVIITFFMILTLLVAHVRVWNMSVQRKLQRDDVRGNMVF